MTEERRLSKNISQSEYMRKRRSNPKTLAQIRKYQKDYYYSDKQVQKREQLKKDEQHKAKRAKLGRDWRKNNKEKYKNGNDERHLKRHYGMTLEDYYRLLDSQNNCCALCKKEFNNEKRKPAVDHCHKTGKIRGIVHPSCNTLLGQANDDISVLKLAITYLEIHDQKKS